MSYTKEQELLIKTFMLSEYQIIKEKINLHNFQYQPAFILEIPINTPLADAVISFRKRPLITGTLNQSNEANEEREYISRIRSEYKNIFNQLVKYLPELKAEELDDDFSVSIWSRSEQKILQIPMVSSSLYYLVSLSN